MASLGGWGMVQQLIVPRGEASSFIPLSFPRPGHVRGRCLLGSLSQAQQALTGFTFCLGEGEGLFRT